MVYCLHNLHFSLYLTVNGFIERYLAPIQLTDHSLFRYISSQNSSTHTQEPHNSRHEFSSYLKKLFQSNPSCYFVLTSFASLKIAFELIEMCNESIKSA